MFLLPQNGLESEGGALARRVLGTKCLYPPTHSHVEVLAPSVSMFGDGAHKEVIRLNNIMG